MTITVWWTADGWVARFRRVPGALDGESYTLPYGPEVPARDVREEIAQSLPQARVQFSLGGK